VHYKCQHGDDDDDSKLITGR